MLTGVQILRNERAEPARQRGRAGRGDAQRASREGLWQTRIGAQTQRPLAIVVVGGMIMTLALTRYLMPVLYSFYGKREPPAGSGDLAH